MPLSGLRCETVRGAEKTSRCDGLVVKVTNREDTCPCSPPPFSICKTGLLAVATSLEMTCTTRPESHEERGSSRKPRGRAPVCRPSRHPLGPRELPGVREPRAAGCARQGRPLLGTGGRVGSGCWGRGRSLALAKPGSPARPRPHPQGSSACPASASLAQQRNVDSELHKLRVLRCGRWRPSLPGPLG